MVDDVGKEIGRLGTSPAEADEKGSMSPTQEIEVRLSVFEA